jgi:hypothetical protein
MAASEDRKMAASEDRKKKSLPAFYSLKAFWAPDLHFGLPEDIWQAAKDNNSLLREYQTFCNKVARDTSLPREVVWNEARTGILDKACDQHGCFSTTALKLATNSLESIESHESLEQEQPQQVTTPNSQLKDCDDHIESDLRERPALKEMENAKSMSKSSAQSRKAQLGGSTPCPPETKQSYRFPAPDRPRPGLPVSYLSPIVEVRTPFAQKENTREDLSGSERSTPGLEHGRNTHTPLLDVPALGSPDDSINEHFSSSPAALLLEDSMMEGLNHDDGALEDTMTTFDSQDLAKSSTDAQLKGYETGPPAKRRKQTTTDIVELDGPFDQLEHAAASVRGSNWFNDDAIETITKLAENDRVQVTVLWQEYETHSSSKHSIARIRPTVRYIIMPVAHLHHWTIAVLDLSSAEVQYFDSMHDHRTTQSNGTHDYVLNIIRHHQHRGRFKLKSEPRINTCVSRKQANGHDCGAYACVNALEYVVGPGILSETLDVPMWRSIFAALIAASAQSNNTSSASPKVAEGARSELMDAILEQQPITRAKWQELCRAFNFFEEIRNRIASICEKRQSVVTRRQREEEALAAQMLSPEKGIAKQQRLNSDVDDVELRMVDIERLITQDLRELQPYRERLAMLQSVTTTLGQARNLYEDRLRMAEQEREIPIWSAVEESCQQLSQQIHEYKQMLVDHGQAVSSGRSEVTQWLQERLTLQRRELTALSQKVGTALEATHQPDVLTSTN